MSRFNFKLQPVLDYKETTEEQKKTEYGKQLQTQSKMEQHLQYLNNQLNNFINSSREIIATSLDVDELKRCHDYMQYIKEEIKYNEINLTKQKQVVEERRVDMLDAVTERKSVQLLKDRHIEEFKAWEKRNEQKEIDRIVSYKYTTA